ncbi:MAG: protein kinase [Deltaproteobacteria bacterium]|nr:protein kinase [Deltaproteobacteria bacterium]
METLLHKSKARKPRPGRIVDGRYRLHDCLGRGGFGQVWRADDTLRGGTVALKLLAYGRGDADVVRFKREFALLAELAHPHINPVLDFGRDSTFGYFFTTPLITGQPILAVVQPAQIEQTLHLAAQVLRALAYLHNRGVFHFDIKPGNLLVSHEEGIATVKVIDFGLAALHPSMEVAGTPSYMAPEFFLGQPADGRADLYAVGVVLYRSLTGENPFQAVTMEDARACHLRHHPPRPSTRNAAVTASVDTFVQTLLAKAPTDRYASADHALRHLALLTAQPLPIEERATAHAYLPTGAVLIGREAQIDQLRQWLDGTAPTGWAISSPVVSLTGAVGMGKTTMLHRVQYEAQLLEYQVRTLWGEEDPTIETFLTQLVQCLATVPNTPTLFLVDDLPVVMDHPSAPELRTLLMTLGERLSRGTLPRVLLCVGTTRLSDEIEQGFAPHVLALESFTEEQVVRYLETIAPLPPAARERLLPVVMQRTHGCPALVHHLAQELVHRQMLVDAGGRWQASQFEDITIDLDDVPLPQLLMRHVETVLEAIPPAGLSVLECLSVWGRPVTMPDLESFFAPPFLRQHLAPLCQGGWVTLQYHAGQGVLDIPDPLLAAAVREQLSPEESASWHEKIAIHLQETGEAPHVIDHHLAESRDPETAQAALVRWCDYARCHEQVVPAIRRLQGLLNGRITEAYRRALLFLVARLQMQADQLDTCDQTIAQLLAQLEPERAVMPHEWLQACELQVMCALRHHHIARADECLATVRASSDMGHVSRPLALRLGNLRARTDMFLGELETAETRYREIWEAQQRLSAEEQRQVDNTELGQCLLLQGRHNAAISQAQAELHLLDIERSPLQVASRQNVVATAWGELGKFRQAERAYNDAIPAARAAQDLRLLIVLYNGLGALHAAQHALERAIDWWERALPLAYRIADFPAVVIIGCNIGHGLLKQRRVNAAEAQFQAAFACAEKAGLPPASQDEYRCTLSQLIGECARLRQDWAGVSHALDRAWALAEAHPQQLRKYRFCIRFTAAEMADDRGQRSEAARLLHLLEDRVAYPRTAEEEAEFQRLRAQYEMPQL